MPPLRPIPNAGHKSHLCKPLRKWSRGQRPWSPDNPLIQDLIDAKSLVLSSGANTGRYDAKRLLQPETVARAIADIVATPPDGHVHEIVIRRR